MATGVNSGATIETTLLIQLLSVAKSILEQLRP